MNTATLTSKGQITIPKEIREALRLHTGDRVSFAFNNESEVTMKTVKKSVDDVFGALHDSKQVPLSVEEMNEAIAARFKANKE